ncbi:MAG TPA: hypothetical protein VGL06_19955 [Pseudonocardiaceae bacterium]
MSAAKKASTNDFQLLPDELIAQVKALVDIGDQTNGLVSSAKLLAEHHPLLGTAPPAMHLSSRLRDAAGPAGLTGEVSAANTELASYHQALRDAVDLYRAGESEIILRLTGDGTQG